MLDPWATQSHPVTTMAPKYGQQFSSGVKYMSFYLKIIASYTKPEGNAVLVPKTSHIEKAQF